MTQIFAYEGLDTPPPRALVARPRNSRAAKKFTAKPATIREFLPLYLAYARHELNLRPRTVQGYRDGILRALKVLGDLRPENLDLQAVLLLKADFATRGTSANWARSILNSLRSFLRFARSVLHLDVFDPFAIRLPRVPRRDVIYLTGAEIEQFLNAIHVVQRDGRPDLRWLAFRSLVEVLLATGMRISEALSLTRTSIDFQTGEAHIVGKGNKERVVFFTDRALTWVKRYLACRSDDADWLFVLPGGKRVCYDNVRLWFSRTRRRAGIKKPVRPHILRHTCATTLLLNGCPIGHIKEILGHDRLETTCRYYLGVDKVAAKTAHRKYLTF